VNTQTTATARRHGLRRHGTKLVLSTAAAAAIAWTVAGGSLAAAATQSPARPAVAPAAALTSGPARVTHPANISGGPVNISGGNFNIPDAATSNGNDVWVANENNEVTELNGSTDAVEATLAAPTYALSGCEGIATDGTEVWVTNSLGAHKNTVVGFDATTPTSAATPPTIISGAAYKFDHPGGIATNGVNVWVANEYSNTVTEFPVAGGTPTVISFSGHPYNFDSPGDITYDGGDLWVTNDAGNSVTAFSAATGNEVAFLSGTGAPYHFKDPYRITSDGTSIWVANKTGNSVTAFNAETGSVVQYLSGGAYQFNSPTGIVADGTDVWVENGGGNSATEVNAYTGAVDGFVTGAGSGGTGPPYDFSGPEGIAIDGLNVWMANTGNNSVTVFPA
jgi:hypothetical protein